MTTPPKPGPTDPGQHAPGVSRTLEENAEENRRRFDRKPAEEAAEEADLTEERERL